MEGIKISRSNTVQYGIIISRTSHRGNKVACLSTGIFAVFFVFFLVLTFDVYLTCRFSFFRLARHFNGWVFGVAGLGGYLHECRLEFGEGAKEPAAFLTRFIPACGLYGESQLVVLWPLVVLSVVQKAVGNFA
jgi:hypothetical protein